MGTDTFKDLFEISQRDKKGLTFYVNGQTIPGIVTKLLDNGGAIEIRNQTFGRIVIRLERVDAVAIN